MMIWSTQRLLRLRFYRHQFNRLLNRRAHHFAIAGCYRRSRSVGPERSTLLAVGFAARNDVFPAFS